MRVTLKVLMDLEVILFLYMKASAVFVWFICAL